jgi:MFS-type transporter involved in bile tolerance (Atg22 family)
MPSAAWSRYKQVMLVLSAWSAVLLFLAFAKIAWISWVIVAVLVCSKGTTNAAMRGFLAETVRPCQSAAFFGISTFAGRIFSALGHCCL